MPYALWGVLVDRVGPLLSAVDAACNEVATTEGQVKGRLKLDVPGAIRPDISPPLLTIYRARHPGVEIEIMVESNLVDIVAAGFDAGIRYAVAHQDRETSHCRRPCSLRPRPTLRVVQ